MLTITSARNQRGWTGADHLLDDGPLTDLVGRTYTTLGALRRAVQRRAKSYPIVEYHNGSRLYRYDGSPTGIPGRHVQVITDLGPLGA